MYGPRCGTCGFLHHRSERSYRTKLLSMEISKFRSSHRMFSLCLLETSANECSAHFVTFKLLCKCVGHVFARQVCEGEDIKITILHSPMPWIQRQSSWGTSALLHAGLFLVSAPCVRTKCSGGILLHVPPMYHRRPWPPSPCVFDCQLRWYRTIVARSQTTWLVAIPMPIDESAESLLEDFVWFCVFDDAGEFVALDVLVPVFVDDDDAAVLVRRLEPDDEDEDKVNACKIVSMKRKILHILAYSNRWRISTVIDLEKRRRFLVLRWLSLSDECFIS